MSVDSLRSKLDALYNEVWKIDSETADTNCFLFDVLNLMGDLINSIEEKENKDA